MRFGVCHVTMARLFIRGLLMQPLMWCLAFTVASNLVYIYPPINNRSHPGCLANHLPLITRGGLLYPHRNMEVKYGNWPLLDKTWLSFVQSLDQCWWGSVSEEQMISALDRPEVKVGAYAIAEYLGEEPGGVCTCIWKTEESGIISFAISVAGGRYRCTKYLPYEYSYPAKVIECMTDILKGGYPMARPRAIPGGQSGFPCVRVVEEMNAMIQLLKSGWWGLSLGLSRNDRSRGSSEHAAVLNTLNTMRSANTNPAAAICYMDERCAGYLFDIVTGKGKAYKVVFDRSGVRCGSRLHFSTIGELIEYMVKARDFTFVPRPSP